MTITLEIRPEIEAELARQAQANGVKVETHIENLIARATDRGSTVPPSSAQDLVELFMPLRGLNLDFERNN